MTDNKYPNGKLNDDDEGALDMAVTVEKGTVMIYFPKPVEWIGLPPDMAIALGQILIQRAKEATH